jgi:ribonuclease VapC
VIDTSALVAFLLGEDDAEKYQTPLESFPTAISSATVLEASIVLEAKQGPDAKRDLDLLLSHLSTEVIPVDQDHVRTAFNAWRRFGKGRHQAALNFGDCFSYATAKLALAPLLYKGSDFSQTDIQSVLN